VLFGGERGLLVSVELSSAAFDGLRRALGESQPRRHDR
jgi:hypothetical protein